MKYSICLGKRRKTSVSHDIVLLCKNVIFYQKKKFQQKIPCWLLVQPVLAAGEEPGLAFTALKADPFPLISADSLPSSGCSAAWNTPFSLLLFVWESCYKLLASQWAWRKDLYTSSRLAWTKPGSFLLHRLTLKEKTSFLWPAAPRATFVWTAQCVFISSGHTGPPLLGQREARPVLSKDKLPVHHQHKKDLPFSVTLKAKHGWDMVPPWDSCLMGGVSWGCPGS